VTAINGDTITIKADADQAGSGEYTSVTTILLTSTTQYDAGRDNSTTASKASITVGSYISAEGTLSADGKTLTASSVGLRPNGPGGGASFGGNFQFGGGFQPNA
jgi:hypothetical protein